MVAVALGGDANVAFQIAASITSIVRSKADNTQLQVYVIDGGVRPRLDVWIGGTLAHRRDCSLTWLTPDLSRLDQLPATPRLPRAAFLRVLLPELLPGHTSRIVWLDADTIVCRDLQALSSAPLGGQPLGAVQEYGARELRHVPGTATTAPILGIDATSRYFNSGVLVIDVPAWRRECITAQVIDYSVRFADAVRFADQDGLNVVLAGRWTPLDPRWNVQIAALRSHARLVQAALPPEIVAARRSLAAGPWILHFAGDRPWCEGLRNPFRSHYFQNLRHSGLLSGTQFRAHEVMSLARSIASVISRGVGR